MTLRQVDRGLWCLFLQDEVLRVPRIHFFISIHVVVFFDFVQGTERDVYPTQADWLFQILVMSFRKCGLKKESAFVTIFMSSYIYFKM